MRVGTQACEARSSRFSQVATSSVRSLLRAVVVPLWTRYCARRLHCVPNIIVVCALAPLNRSGACRTCPGRQNAPQSEANTNFGLVSAMNRTWAGRYGGFMRIAQVAPLYESVPPRGYGGTERVVSYLTEELVRQGHEVTLFASGDSVTDGRLVAPCSK